MTPATPQATCTQGELQLTLWLTQGFARLRRGHQQTSRQRNGVGQHTLGELHGPYKPEPGGGPRAATRGGASRSRERTSRRGRRGLKQKALTPSDWPLRENIPATGASLRRGGPGMAEAGEAASVTLYCCCNEGRSAARGTNEGRDHEEGAEKPEKRQKEAEPQGLVTERGHWGREQVRHAR